MTQFTCKGVKQINNRISFKYDIHLYHSYLSTFFVSVGVPNGEFPEILIAKCRSRFYCTWFFSRAEDFESWREGPLKSREKFFVGGRSCGRKRCVWEINVSHAGDQVHVGDKALMRETPVQRGRVNRYVNIKNNSFQIIQWVIVNKNSYLILTWKKSGSSMK